MDGFADPVETITVDELVQLAEITLLDIRDQQGWDLGHAPGAVHIPLAELPARFGELDLDTDVYVICRGGGQAPKAVRYLELSGVDATAVDGGMLSWGQQNRPVVRDDGTSGSVL